jgi:uncharacterized protein YegP (UPF0339 family)
MSGGVQYAGGYGLWPRVEIGQGRDLQWYWHLKTANGEIVCQGEGYVSKEGRRSGVERVRAAFSSIGPNSF